MGDVGVFLRITAPFDGVALEDTFILTIDAVRFHRLLEQRPRIAGRWVTSVSNRLISYQARLMEVLAGGLESQVASVLVHRADHDVVKLSQSNIAELVGVNRSSVNRVLKRLEEQKLLLARYGEIQILDKASLAKIAGL